MSMGMVEVRAAELVGAALDWSVAKAEGVFVRILAEDNPMEKWQVQRQWNMDGPYWPSQDWSQAGPLIERLKVVIVYHNAPGKTPMACIQDKSPAFMAGPTVLIAACRAIVHAKLGETVLVPKELVK